MTNIVITGSDGFLGWHLRCRLHALKPDAKVTSINRSAFADDRLEESLRHADTVIHLAAVNSHDTKVSSENDEITKRLLQALATTGATPRIIISNSTHALKDTSYGLAKRRVVETLRNWADAAGTTATEVILPNLFGEGGKPFSNSVVATMCESLNSGTTFVLNQDGQTELLHSQDAAGHLINACSEKIGGTSIISGEKISVPELFRRLKEMYELYYKSNTIPPLDSDFGLRLFNQLRFAMYPHSYPVSLRSGRDKRGAYTELVRSFEGSQVSVSTTNPGSVRGEHFHFDKIERFAVIAGSAVVQIRRLFNDQIISFELSGDNPTFIDIPTLHTHNLINTGQTELVTVFWSNDHFDPAHPDTYSEKISEGRLQ